MANSLVLFAVTLQIFGSSLANPMISDHSWTTVNCHRFELVLDDASNYTTDQILLHSRRNGIAENDDDNEPSSQKKGHCFAIKKFSEDILSFDNYGISVSMLHVKSNQNLNSFGNIGLVFNYQDELNYDFVYLSSEASIPTTTFLPPGLNTETSTMVASRVRSERQVESVKQYFFQAGYRNGDQFTYTEKIQLNRHLTENVWHRLSLIVDKDSNSTVRIFFDDDYVGSFRESLPPRDVGGVMTLNLYENEALFKKFVVGRCLRFSSAGECVERPNNCPDGYVLIGGKCFYITEDTETYMDAVTMCNIKGGRLYEPRDAQTYLILARYLEKVLGYTTSSTYRTWIGITDRDEEGTNVYESDGATLTYENWQSGYGVHRGVADQYDCAYIYYFTSTRRWLQGYCNHGSWRYRYICETSD